MLAKSDLRQDGCFCNLWIARRDLMLLGILLVSIVTFGKDGPDKFLFLFTKI